MLLERWQQLSKDLPEQEQVHLLNLIRSNKNFEFAEMVLDQLENSPNIEVRRCAASTLEALPQEKYVQPHRTQYHQPLLRRLLP